MGGFGSGPGGFGGPGSGPSLGNFHAYKSTTQRSGSSSGGSDGGSGGSAGSAVLALLVLGVSAFGWMLMLVKCAFGG